MTEETKLSGRALLQEQMRSRPIRTKGPQVTEKDDGRMDISIPLRHRTIVQLLQKVLPVSKEKNLELDRLGTRLYNLCDGTHSVEELVEMHQREWLLTFFEARAMVLQYLRLLSQRNLILFLKPDEKGNQP